MNQDHMVRNLSYALKLFAQYLELATKDLIDQIQITKYNTR